jgi:predicted aldo/keto reductase-like oxidoreductase
MANDASEAGIQRRQFLVRGAAATLGLGLGGGLAKPAWTAPDEPRIRSYRPLGRTGLEISDISFGSSRSTDPALVTRALELGVNYFDTAESYKDGRSEAAIGEALQGHRDRVILTSKVKCETDTTSDALMASLEGSLRRLRTDRVDIYFNHAVNDPDRLRNDAWYTFAERAKQQGKIRFTGVSGHGSRLGECLDLALDENRVDVILCAYNFGQDPSFYQRFTSRMDWIAVQEDLPRIIEKAHAKGVGVVAMKTLRGARLNDMRPYETGGATFAQAAFRWVLSNPHLGGLIISMKTMEQIDEFVAASGAPAPSAAELDLLEQYLLGSADGYCDHGCNACEPGCPHGVPVSEVLRTRMYATDYGDPEYASEDYARLSPDAAACVTCADHGCLGRCPHGLEIPRLTSSAHRWLARPGTRAG